MKFLIDTGSPWTWVPSKDCPDNECTKSHYDYTKSSSFRKSNRKIELSYFVGYIQGFIISDSISISNSLSTAAKDVNFLSVTHAKKFDDLVSDGLLGLSPSANFGNV